MKIYLPSFVIFVFVFVLLIVGFNPTNALLIGIFLQLDHITGLLRKEK